MDIKQLHSIQIKILQKLLFADRLRYSEVRPVKDIENNKLSFHLKKLIEEGFVEKRDEYYLLTNTGKEFANRIGTDPKLSLQAKISVVVALTRIFNIHTIEASFLRLPRIFEWKSIFRRKRL